MPALEPGPAKWLSSIAAAVGRSHLDPGRVVARQLDPLRACQAGLGSSTQGQHSG